MRSVIAKFLPLIRTALLLSAVATLNLAVAAHAQFTPLPIGTATVDVDPATCSPDQGWLSGGACTHYEITGCANAQKSGRYHKLRAS